MGDRPLRELEHGDGSSRALAQHLTLAAGLHEPTQDKTSQDDLEKELQNEANRLWVDIQSKPAALPPEAYKQLAKAKKELEQGNRQGAVEILKTEPAVWCNEALYHLGCCMALDGKIHAAFIYWACAIEKYRPIMLEPLHQLDLLWKLTKYCEQHGWTIDVDIGWESPSQDPFYYFQELAQLLERVPAQDKEAFLARSRNAPETSLLWRLCSETSRRTVNPEAGGTIPRVQRERNDQRTGPDQQQETAHEQGPAPSSPERDDVILPISTNPDAMESAPAWASFIKRVEKLLWQIVRSRPTASHSASSSSSSSMPGAAELAEAKRLFQTKTNDNDVLVVDKLRREPAFWHPEALYLLGCCVESGRGVPRRNAELASLYWICALEATDASGTTVKPFYYLDILWKLAEYFEKLNPNYFGKWAAPINYGKIFKVENPWWYLKELARLVWKDTPEHQELFLHRSREAPQTSLLSKLTWDAWLSLSVSTRAMQLSVEMQRFAASLKQQSLLQLKKDCLKDFQWIFLINPEPTAEFVRDLCDVLGRWWLGRTDTHAAVRVTAMREVLLGEDVLVEHTTAIKLQRLRKEYKQCNADQELVPRKWASRHRKKQNLFSVWEEDCAKAMHEKDFQRLLLPRGLALDQTAGSDPSCVREVPDWGALIRDCFKAPDGDFFVLWLVQQVRACRPMQERPVQSWLCLAGQVPLLLKQILRSYCQILGDEHVAVFRDGAKDHDWARKNAELQQSLLVVLDGCSRQAHDASHHKKLLKVLRSDREVPGKKNKDKQLEPSIGTLLQLAEPASIKSLPDVPSSEELAQYLHACALEHLALSESPARSVPFITSSQASEDGFERWESAFRRDVNQFKLPGLDKQTETVFCVGQGTNGGRFAVQPQHLVESFESFLGFEKGELSERAEKLFWDRLQASFPGLDLTKKFNHNMYTSSGHAKGLLFPKGLLSPSEDSKETRRNKKAKKKRKRDQEEDSLSQAAPHEETRRNKKAKKKGKRDQEKDSLSQAAPHEEARRNKKAKKKRKRDKEEEKLAQAAPHEEMRREKKAKKKRRHDREEK
eukprot:g35855.t1